MQAKQESFMVVFTYLRQKLKIRERSSFLCTADYSYRNQKSIKKHEHRAG